MPQVTIYEVNGRKHQRVMKNINTVRNFAYMEKTGFLRKLKLIFLWKTIVNTKNDVKISMTSKVFSSKPNEAKARLVSCSNIPYLALFLKATFWHAASRLPLFQSHRPARVYAFTWRPDFDGRRAPTMDCIWSVWDGKTASTTYDVLSRPASGLKADYLL